MYENRPRWMAYVVAVAVTTIALLLRWPLWPVLEDHAALLTFIPAVVLSAYWGGLGPGLVATLLGALGGYCFLNEPLGLVKLLPIYKGVALVMFVLVGAFISGLSEALHRAKAQIRASERKLAGEALLQERCLLHALLNNIPDKIYFKDRASRFLRINKSLATFFGLSDPAQAQGKTDFDFFREEHARPAFEDEQEIIRTGQPLIGKDEKGVRLDGRVGWVSTTKMPLRDKDGTIIGTFGVSRDITQLKGAAEALRKSEQRFRGTFENAAVGIIHTDAAGRILRVNEKFCDIVGFPREELLGKTFQDITHPDDRNIGLDSFAALMAGKLPSYRLEKRYVRKDGAAVQVELFVSLQRDAGGEPAFAIAMIQDISERRRLELDLRRAVEAAESANKAKDEFLANVSHEIRTPMNAILGMTDLMLATALSEDQRQCLRTVKSAADNLLGIINDLLDFSQIEAGKMKLTHDNFSLRAAVADTLKTLAVRADKKGLELIGDVQPDVPDAVIGDAGRLRQVLLNLVGNAIKFTEKGEVVVEVGVVSGGGVSGRKPPRPPLTTHPSPLTTHPSPLTCTSPFATPASAFPPTSRIASSAPSSRRTPRPPASTAAPGWA